ncbi:MAG: M23 family metallopeptidase, partial [Candidatus Dojkabacteria bacterium]
VYAAGVGTVVNIRSNVNCDGCKDYGLGNYVAIDHGNGLVTKYGHLMYEANPILKVGQIVTSDTQIGRMGSSGYSTGPHLHFMVEVHGVHTDPVQFLGVEQTNLNVSQFATYCSEENAYGSSSQNSNFTNIWGNQNDPWAGKTAADLGITDIEVK